MNSKLIPIVVILVLSLCASPAFAQEASAQGAAGQAEAEKPRKSSSRFPKDVAGLEAMAREAIAEGNGLRLLQTTILLRRQEPYEPSHMVNMVRAYAMMERPTSSYNYMLEMQQQGLSYDFDQLQETINLHGTEVYDYLNDLLIRAGDPAGEAEPVFELDAKYAVPQAISWDASRERFLVGTVRDGTLLAVDAGGKTSKLLEADEENGLWAIMDIAVDAGNNRLWLSSSAIPQFERRSADNSGKAGLFEFELDSLEMVGRYLPDPEAGPYMLGPIALGADGDVFVADREAAILYRKKGGSDLLAPFVADKELSGFRHMAITPDGSRLYLADTAKGILVIDPKNESAAMLKGPDTLNLGGIGGLFHAGNELIIIQSGINPDRLMALQLDPSGGEVQEVRPMAIALEWFEGPSGGTIKDDALFYFADAQLLDVDARPKDVTVLRTALDAGTTIVAPDMQKFEDETLSPYRNRDKD